MRYIPLLILLSVNGVAQTISSSQQKALNNYMIFADNSVEEMSAIVKSVTEYYPSIQQLQKNKNSFVRKYSCPVQLEEYYYKTAVAESKVLGGSANTLNQRLNSLKSAADKVDANCKALDTYFKLEDYKQDNYSGALDLIRKFPDLLKDYQNVKQELIRETENTYKKLSSSNGGAVNSQAISMMWQRLEHEKSFLDLWSYNLEEDTPTGWPNEALSSSILQTDKLIKEAEQHKLSIKYPASSMYASFNEGMASILENKRDALDGYNAEAKKSDRHGNETYLGLINYYNGVLVSFYNSFIDYAQQDGFYGLKVARYLPVFEIRTKAREENVKVEAFKDEAHFDLQPIKQSAPISSVSSLTLNNYVDFINESMRQSNNLQMALRSFSSSAAYYKGLSSFQGKGGLTYNYSDFKIPLAQFQKTVSESSSISSSYAKNLNLQTEVIIRIMNEMEALSEALEKETTERRYEQDHLKRVYEILERYKVLFEVIDNKKEILYKDVRSVYDSYPLRDPNANWIVSWKALRSLTDFDHKALFEAKAFYKGSSTTLPASDNIDNQLRDVIAKEYENMKGIEKYGRNNGLCPYTPYEDIPQTSRMFSEKLKKVSLPKENYTQHPYHDLVYLYNDVVDDYNKFCELSRLGLLKTVKQPEWFDIKYPTKESPSASTQEVQHPPVVAVSTITPNTTQLNSANQSTTNASLKVVHDTVYIERRETVYLADPGENLRSMEGYATNNMVLLLDVSGSMNSPEKLPLLKTSVLNLLDMMRQEDQVSIVVYSGKAKVLLQPTSFKEQEKIRQAINSLTSSGQTDGNAGIRLAYQVADKNYIRGGNNRIILATDGEFPISEEVFTMAEKFSREDIFVTVFNFGKTTASAKNLEKLSRKGKGNYEHITKENMELKLIKEAKAKKAR